MYLILLVTPAGFEPATTRLEGECSIQLSYGVIDFGFVSAAITVDQLWTRS
jgi:hypothetical protein